MSTALLLSGGMDSIAIAFWRRPDLAITIDYGQIPAAAELRAANAVCADLEIVHQIIKTDLRSLGSGDMAGTAALEVASVSEWWPFRNQMLVTLAAMKGVTLGVNHLLIGTLRTDNAHRDGTAQFIQSMSSVLEYQEGAVTLDAPAINMSSAELIRSSGIPLEVLAWAHSCHMAEEACGQCRGCRKHYETMTELGFDPY
jgi:7-cyano-7-deazaguanine synthase